MNDILRKFLESVEQNKPTTPGGKNRDRSDRSNSLRTPWRRPYPPAAGVARSTFAPGRLARRRMPIPRVARHAVGGMVFHVLNRGGRPHAAVRHARGLRRLRANARTTRLG